MNKNFTILIESADRSEPDALLHTRRAAEFAKGLKKIFPGAVEEEEPGANIVQNAHDIWTFVVAHKDDVKLLVDLTSTATSIVTALITFAQGSKAKVKIIDSGGREISVEADHSTDAVKLLEDVLRSTQPQT